MSKRAKQFRLAHQYKVYINGEEFGDFNTCDAVSVQFNVIKIATGGRKMEYKRQGRAEFQPVKLARGRTADKRLWNLLQQSYNSATGGSEDVPVPEINIDIAALRDDMVTEYDRMRIKDAFVTSWSSGAWGSEEAQMEEIAFDSDSPPEWVD